jgi:hypothetical protein
VFTHILFGLDAMVCIVFHPCGRPHDNPKRYRFTPPVSKWRMPDRLSVDALCGFGAKNFNRCTEFIQCGRLATLNGSLFISQFGVFCVVAGSVMVRPDRKRFMLGRVAGRLCFLGLASAMVRREACGVRRYAAVLSLGAPSLGMDAKLKLMTRRECAQCSF